jgi:hypothetical protein
MGRSSCIAWNRITMNPPKTRTIAKSTHQRSDSDKAVSFLKRAFATGDLINPSLEIGSIQTNESPRIHEVNFARTGEKSSWETIKKILD